MARRGALELFTKRKRRQGVSFTHDMGIDPSRPPAGQRPATSATGATASPSRPGRPAEVPGAPRPYVTPTDVSWQDQQYFDTQAGIDKNLGNLKGSILGAGNNLGLDYGIEFDRDPNDPMKASNFRIAKDVDVSNPFSKAALMKRFHDQNQRAARGNIDPGAGYLQSKLNKENFNYDQGKDSLLKDFGSRFGGLYEQWLAGQGTATQQGLENTATAQNRNANTPAPAATGTREIPVAQATAAGLTFKAVNGQFVVFDSQGKPIPGARIEIKGNKHIVRVPG